MHYATTLSNIDNQIVAIGGGNPSPNNKGSLDFLKIFFYYLTCFIVEIFNIGSSSWETKSDYPFCTDMIVDYSTISFRDFILLMGGLCHNDDSSETHSIIAKFRNNIWTQAGNLMTPRRYQRSVVMNDLVYVIGGRGT